MSDSVDQEIVGRKLSGVVAAVLFLILIGVTSLAGAGLLGDPADFREYVEELGAAGLGLALGLALLHAVVPYPAELLGLATGYAYGFLPAFALMVVLWTISSLVAYWLARRYGRRIADRFVEPEAIERTEARIAKGGTPMLLILRVIPIVPYNLVSYAAGMFEVPLRRFTWTTAVGLAPQLAIVTYAGSEAVDLSATDPRIWAIGLGWLGLIFVGRALALRLGSARQSA